MQAENINVEIARNMYNDIRSFIANLEDYEDLIFFIKNKLFKLEEKYSLEENAPSFLDIYMVIIKN